MRTGERREQKKGPITQVDLAYVTVIPSRTFKWANGNRLPLALNEACDNNDNENRCRALSRHHTRPFQSHENEGR